MARKKQRETYGNGSITPKLDKSGKQMTDKQGKLLWPVCLSFGSETVTDENGNQRKKRRKVYAVTKRVFKYAVNNDWLVRNPCDKITAPKIDEATNRRSLSAEECARFRACLDQAEADAFAEFDAKEERAVGFGTKDGRKLVRGLSAMSCLMAVRIELATGLRRSEVLGLTWSAIDFERSQITVHQKLVIEKRCGSKEAGKLKVGTPKTKMGTRSLFVDEDTMAHLKHWKEVQAQAIALVMPEGEPLKQTEETPVCVGDRGGWMRPPTISRWWEGYNQKSRKKGDEGRVYRKPGFRDEIGFPGLCMHELRHTQATQLLGAGVDLKTVQARMGHAKASHTLDLYAHAIPANDRDAANIMGSLYNVPAAPATASEAPELDKSA